VLASSDADTTTNTTLLIIIIIINRLNTIVVGKVALCAVHFFPTVYAFMCAACIPTMNRNASITRQNNIIQFYIYNSIILYKYVHCVFLFLTQYLLYIRLYRGCNYYVCQRHGDGWLIKWPKLKYAHGGWQIIDDRVIRLIEPNYMLCTFYTRVTG